VSFGHNLEDFVKPLLTKVYAPQGAATVNGYAAANSATSRMIDAWVSHANELLNSGNAARWAAVDALMNAAHLTQLSHEQQ
jgi:hypothetical protein